MAAGHQLQSVRNHPNLQRFLIANARPTGRQLGVGSYGSVEELEVSGVVCAGKKIHETLIEQGNFGAENITSKYVEECQLMSDLRHPHLVQFLGVCFLPNSTLPMLVMECLVTSLDDLIEQNPDIPLSLKRSILADVARGLVYLHSRSPPVIHRDLTAKNVLLNSAMVAKISDLGNARIVNFQPGQLARILSRIPGTMVYMPPEAFGASSKYGPSLDNFSFGQLSLFAITQVFPGNLLQHTYRDPENPRHRLACTEVQRRDEYMKLLHQQLGEQHPLVLLVKQCLDDEPSERPSAQELLQRFEDMRAQIEDPYQYLTKLEAMRMIREKDQDLHTQVEALSTSRQELEALKTKMEHLQVETSSQLTSKDAEITRLGDKLKKYQEEYSSQITAKDAQLTAKDAQLIAKDAQLIAKVVENSRLDEDLRRLQADLESREVCIREMGAETEQREAKMDTLTAKLRDLQSQLQKAQKEHSSQLAATDSQLIAKVAENITLGEDLRRLQAELEAREAHIREIGAETEIHRLTAELRDLQSLQLQKAPVTTDLPSKHKEDKKEKSTADASSSLVSDSVSASSTPHTRPGGENPVEKDIYGYFDHIPAHLSGPKVAEKNITTAAAVDHSRQDKRLQNKLGDLETREQELGSEPQQKEAEIDRQLTVSPTQPQKSPVTPSGSPMKPAASGDVTESSGEGESMGAVRVMNKPPDKPEQPTVSGSPKKSAISGDGAESSGGCEGKGAAGVMKKSPDQPEPPIVQELEAKEQDIGAEGQQKEAEIDRQLTVTPTQPHKTPVTPSDPPKKKPAASGGLAKALGEGKSKGVMGILDECPDEPELEPAVMVIKRAALITDEKTTPMVLGESPQSPIRAPNMAGKDDKETGEGGGGAVAAAVSLVNLTSKVDISGQLSAELMKELRDKKWKIREEALKKVQTIIASAKFIQPSLGELPAALKWMLWDSNKNLVVTTLGIIGSMATAMGSSCSNFCTIFIPRVLGVLADSKPQVRQAAFSCLNAWHAEITLVPFVEQEFISNALATKNPNLRMELFTWLENKLPTAGKLPSEVSSIVPRLFSCLEDRSSDVRKKAQKVLPLVMAKVGYDTMLKHTDKLRPASKQLVKDLIDKHCAAVPHPQETAKQPLASASPTSSKRTAENEHKPDEVQKKEEPKRETDALEDFGSGGISGGGASVLKKTTPKQPIGLLSEHEDIKKKHTEDTSSSIASVAASSARPNAATNYATAVVRPWQGSTEGLQEVWRAGTEVVGKYDFPGSAARDLPFKRGDTLTISRKTKDPNWYYAKRYDGRQGMIPQNYVRKKSTGDASLSTTLATPSSTTHTRSKRAVKLQFMPWFHGELSREGAEALLTPYKNGNFLVRNSNNYKGDYTLCVSYGDKVEHYRVRRNENSWLTFDDEEYFENLSKFIEHYRSDADGLCCRLRHAVWKTSGNIEYTVSQQDFKESGWAIPRNSIRKKSLIGNGEFKDVWLGEHQGQKVAIMMTKDTKDSMATMQLLAEAAIMTTLRHPNLVCLIGISLDELPLYLITEYMAKGSLLDYLRSRGRTVFSKQNQLDIARDVCKGMVYLESQNFVHRNLAARNVLIGDDNTAKVSDFRLTRDVTLKTEEVKLLVKWTAPEALRENKFSNKSDVWSFGIFLWEIYTYGRVPYPQVNVRNVLAYVERGNRMNAPDGCPDDIYQIMNACWDKDASIRPNFAHIQSTLESVSVS